MCKFKIKTEKIKKSKVKKDYAGTECSSCGNYNGSAELHACPYQSEINNDDSDCCNCCRDCEHECAMDV